MIEDGTVITFQGLHYTVNYRLQCVFLFLEIFRTESTLTLLVRVL